jgi:hypothetical protein
MNFRARSGTICTAGRIVLLLLALFAMSHDYILPAPLHTTDVSRPHDLCLRLLHENYETDLSNPYKIRDFVIHLCRSLSFRQVIAPNHSHLIRLFTFVPRDHLLIAFNDS